MTFLLIFALQGRIFEEPVWSIYEERTEFELSLSQLQKIDMK